MKTMNTAGKSPSPFKSLATVALAWALGAGISVASIFATATPSNDNPDLDAPRSSMVSPPVGERTSLDRSGRPQFGKASFYKDTYSGKTMADGTPMHLYSNNAASITLPLGTTAQVTNLDTGLSTVVTIRDRGPYVHGRIVDLSPASAHQIGLRPRQGLARVRVSPLTIPMADGSVKVVRVALASNSLHDPRFVE